MPSAASPPAWAPQEPGVQQICYLLSEYQKPGTNQSQVVHVTTNLLLVVHAYCTLPREDVLSCTVTLCVMEVCAVLLQILAQLEECKNIPDFNNYLAFILSQGDSLPVEVSDRRCFVRAKGHTQTSSIPKHQCLAMVACPQTNCALQVRQSAGLLLKNNLKQQYTALPEDYRQYVKVTMHCLLLHI